MIKTQKYITTKGWSDPINQPGYVESISVKIGDIDAYVLPDVSGNMRVIVRNRYDEVLCDEIYVISQNEVLPHADNGDI